MLHVTRVVRAVVAAFVMAFCLTGATCGGITLGVNAPSENAEPEFPPDGASSDASSVAENDEQSIGPGAA